MGAGEVPGMARVEGAARAAAEQAGPAIRGLARFGFAAKGAVYILVGGLAAAAAFTETGRTTGSSGALATLADSAGGKLLLAVIALGLGGYVVWRLVSAILDPEHQGAGKRAFYALTALIYGGLALEAARLALSGGGGGESGEASHWSAELMSQPFGRVLAVAVGLVVLGYGVHQLLRAWRVDLDDRLDLGAMTRRARLWIVRFSRFGLAARGAVLTVIGVWFTAAALRQDPSAARGVGDVLSGMRDTPWLLALVGLGLVAYGAYELVRARYRRIRAA